MADIPVPAAGNPAAAFQSVWSSRKVRTALVGALTSVLGAVATTFLLALIPKLGAEQVSQITSYVVGGIALKFSAAIGGAAYVDGKTQEAADPQ